MNGSTTARGAGMNGSPTARGAGMKGSPTARVSAQSQINQTWNDVLPPDFRGSRDSGGGWALTRGRAVRHAQPAQLHAGQPGVERRRTCGRAGGVSLRVHVALEGMHRSQADLVGHLACLVVPGSMLQVSGRVSLPQECRSLPHIRQPRARAPKLRRRRSAAPPPSSPPPRSSTARRLARAARVVGREAAAPRVQRHVLCATRAHRGEKGGSTGSPSPEPKSRTGRGGGPPAPATSRATGQC
eukprot:gene25452-biopygen19495